MKMWSFLVQSFNEAAQEVANMVLYESLRRNTEGNTVFGWWREIFNEPLYLLKRLVLTAIKTDRKSPLKNS